MCNTAYNLKAFFFSSLVFFVIIHFGHPFVVTACTHSNMSLKFGGRGGGGGGGAFSPCLPLANTLAHPFHMPNLISLEGLVFPE